MGLTKLDMYDYILLPGIIRIVLEGRNDPSMVDILSEIELSDGRIYVEGCYFAYLDKYRIEAYDSKYYLELEVVELKAV